MSKQPHEPLPPDEIFSDGIVFSEVLFDEVEEFRLTWEEIDWEQEIDLPEQKKEALTRAATQFQYGNMAHLILCGKILKGEMKHTTLDMQKLATVLSSYKIEGIDLWGRYVREMGAGEEVSREMQRYYQHIFSKQEAVSALLGMGVLSGPLAYAVYTTVDGEGDPLFNQIVGRSIQAKEREMDLITKFLTPIIASDTTPNRQKMTELAEQYAQVAMKILQTNGPAIKRLDLDRRHVLDQVERNIQEFYRDIGIRTES